MFRKVQKKLTLLCGCTISLILFVLSAALLLVSEKNQRESSFFYFQSDMSSLLTGLESQQTISHMWLKKMENQKYRIYLTDGDTPYLFTRLTFSEEALAALEALRLYCTEYKLDASSLTSYSSLHAEFPWSEKSAAEVPLSKATHYVGCMSFLQNNSCITAIVLAPQQSLHDRLLWQRTLFILVDLAGSLLFFVLSWILTGRLLEPVKESQQRQIDFVAAASHELRTPLSVILASATACEIAPPADQKRFLSNIRREGKRMQGLLSDMLFLANTSAKAAAPIRVSIDLETLLLNVYENFEPLTREQKLSFTLDLPENDLPAFECDPEKITQLLSILLQNALSYTPAGGSVTLRIRTDTSKVFLSVLDTGCGIPDADKKRIFDRFYRCESARSQKNHFGLGLAIAQSIVQEHHGTIRVTDNEPCGSIFTVTLAL